MQLNVLSTLALGAAVLLAGCNQNSQPSSAQAVTPKPVYTVDAVTLERPGSTAAVVIKASGTVRTSGWTDTKLEAETNASPSDTMTYTLVATPPPKDTNVTQAMQPVEATLRVDNLPPEVKTVRVIAETNQTDAAMATNATEPAPSSPMPDNNAAPSEQPPVPAPQ